MKEMHRISIDDAEFKRWLKKAALTEYDMLSIEKPVALSIVNHQRAKVPVKTGATKLSIMQHLQSSSKTKVVDHVGPETSYAPFIEYGTSNPNYPVQPFVRPSVYGKENRLAKVAATVFLKLLGTKFSWQK